MKTSWRLFIPAGIIILVAIGYLIFQEQKTELVTTTNTPVPTTSPSPTPTATLTPVTSTTTIDESITAASLEVTTDDETPEVNDESLMSADSTSSDSLDQALSISENDY